MQGLVQPRFLKHFIDPCNLRVVQFGEQLKLLHDVLHRRIGAVLVVELHHSLLIRGSFSCEVYSTLPTLSQLLLQIKELLHLRARSLQSFDHLVPL